MSAAPFGSAKRKLKAALDPLPEFGVTETGPDGGWVTMGGAGTVQLPILCQPLLESLLPLEDA